MLTRIYLLVALAHAPGKNKIQFACIYNRQKPAKYVDKLSIAIRTRKTGTASIIVDSFARGIQTKATLKSLAAFTY